MNTPGFAVCPVLVSPAVASVVCTVMLGKGASLSIMVPVALFTVPTV